MRWDTNNIILMWIGFAFKLSHWNVTDLEKQHMKEKERKKGEKKERKKAHESRVETKTNKPAIGPEAQAKNQSPRNCTNVRSHAYLVYVCFGSVQQGDRASV